jgi:hypothetical protein
VKRSTKLLGSPLLVVALFAVAGYYGVRTEACRKVLARESSNPGLTCLWRVDGQQDVKRTPTWWQIVCGARPTYVHIEWPAFESDHQGAQEFAEAFRFFGSLEDFSVGYNCPEVMTLLCGLGPQPHLTQLNCFHAPVTDALSQALPGFPQLRGVSLVPSQFTGRGFPPMPNLEAADLSWSPITADGLRAIATSPKLTTIKLADHPNPTSSLYAAIKELHVARPSLDIWGLDAQ